MYKKLVLWTVVTLQICFIACIWLFQLGLNANLRNLRTTTLTDGTTPEDEYNNLINNNINQPTDNVRVNFITKLITTTYPKIKLQLLNKNINNFYEDFILKKPPKYQTNRLNDTELLMEKDDILSHAEYNNSINSELWCFKLGTINETSSSMRKQQQDYDDYMEILTQQCNCQHGWHGKDCGQPETIWRTLMKSKTPIKLLTPTQLKHVTNRLIYMIEGNFISFELLELQLNAINDVVDYFIFYYKYAKHNELKSIEHKLKELLKHNNYYLYFCNKNNTKMTDNNCATSANAYAQFHSHLLKMQSSSSSYLLPNDLFLYTNNEYEILSSHALKFLKYYQMDVHLMRFRLKYNVYGFYWQHPLKTKLSGIISSLRHLDNPKIGNRNPSQLLKLAYTRDISKSLIIGDLNHYGGWYCKYCQQPDEIIAQLYRETISSNLSNGNVEMKSSLNTQIGFPNVTRNRNIDVAYIQKSIANGLHIDGKTKLLKLYRRNDDDDDDKYFAPKYAITNDWKYSHLLVNYYEQFDDDLLEDDAFVQY